MKGIARIKYIRDKIDYLQQSDLIFEFFIDCMRKSHKLVVELYIMVKGSCGKLMINYISAINFYFNRNFQ